MNKRQQQKRQRNAEKMLEAVQEIQEWFNTTRRFTFIAEERGQGRITANEVYSAIEALKHEAYLRIYYSQDLNENTEAVLAARQWNTRMFAGVTSDRETIMGESVGDVLRGMAIHGMIWDEIVKAWYSPDTVKAMEDCKRRNGNRWTQVWYDGAPESEY